MLLGPFSGEEMEVEEVKALIDVCCEPEDEDGCIPYESTKEITIESFVFALAIDNYSFVIFISGFLQELCAGPFQDFFQTF